MGSKCYLKGLSFFDFETKNFRVKNSYYLHLKELDPPILELFLVSKSKKDKPFKSFLSWLWVTWTSQLVRKRFLHRFDFVNWASRDAARTVDHLFDIFFLTFSCVWFSVSIKALSMIIFSCACQRQSSHSVQFQCASTIVYHQSENISKVISMLATDVGDEL